MNCTQTRDWLARQALEPAPEAEAPEAEAHLSDCAACRSARAGLATLSRWNPEDPPLGLAEKTMRALQAEPAQEFWIDRWVAAVSTWLQSRHPASMAAIACVLFLVVLAPNVMRGRAQSALSGCETNLRTLAVGLDDYATAHEGRYPSSLAQLPVTLPRCPSVDSSTYELQTSADGHAYTVFCAGQHHRHENFPQFTSEQGPQGEDRH